MTVKRWLIVFALVWLSRDFQTMSDLVAFLNALPAERQLEAKIIVGPPRPTRNLAGWLGTPYTLVYRGER